jgi:GcrA cell cycle regulator
VRRVDGPTLPPLPSAVADADAAMPFAETPPPLLRPDFGQGSTLSGVTPTSPRPSVMTRPIVPAPAVPRPIVQGTRAVALPPPRPVPAAPRPYGRVVTCCWPIGEPGTREFHFCDVPSEPGRPYCEEHVKIAYVKIRDRREDAA